MLKWAYPPLKIESGITRLWKNVNCDTPHVLKIKSRNSDTVVILATHVDTYKSKACPPSNGFNLDPIKLDWWKIDKFVIA